MDPVSAFVSIVVAAMALASTIWVTKMQSRNLRETRTQELYRDVSAKFLGAVEVLQLDLDTSYISGVGLDDDRYQQYFWELETSRARLDILVPGSVRIWAYRVRLAIEAVKQALEDPKLDYDEYLRVRCLLHTARAEAVANIRKIASSEPDWSDVSQQLTLNRDGRPDAHKEWLKTDPYGDSRAAVDLALESMKGSALSGGTAPKTLSFSRRACAGRGRRWRRWLRRRAE